MMHSPRFEGWQPWMFPSIMLPLICWTKKSEEGGNRIKVKSKIKKWEVLGSWRLVMYRHYLPESIG